MILSFGLTYFEIAMLLKAREVSSCSRRTFSDLTHQALGRKGKILVDTLLVTVLFSFVISFTYFVLESMKSLLNELFRTNIDVLT